MATDTETDAYLVVEEVLEPWERHAVFAVALTNNPYLDGSAVADIIDTYANHDAFLGVTEGADCEGWAIPREYRRAVLVGAAIIAVQGAGIHGHIDEPGGLHATLTQNVGDVLAARVAATLMRREEKRTTVTEGELNRAIGEASRAFWDTLGSVLGVPFADQTKPLSHCEIEAEIALAAAHITVHP